MPEKQRGIGTGRNVLTCEKLEVGYHGKAILPPIDLSIGRGEFWVVLGRNGSGKTTLFRTILGLISPVRGTLLKEPSDLRCSYIPQRNAFDELFPMTAVEVVAQGQDRKWSFLKPKFGQSQAINKALEEVDALDFAAKPFNALSEGQKQRVLLARLIVSEPDLAFLDEPTAAMDVVAEKEAFEYLDGFRKGRDTAVVVVSHYLEVARKFADQVLFLDQKAGRIVTGDPREVFANESFRLSYSNVILKDECYE